MIKKIKFSKRSNFSHFSLSKSQGTFCLNPHLLLSKSLFFLSRKHLRHEQRIIMKTYRECAIRSSMALRKKLKNDIKCMKILFVFTHVNVVTFFYSIILTGIVRWRKDECRGLCVLISRLNPFVADAHMSVSPFLVSMRQGRSCRLAFTFQQPDMVSTRVCNEYSA